MTIATRQTETPFRPSVVCSFPDHRRKSKECGEPGVALLVSPIGFKSGRCQQHQEIQAAVIRNDARWQYWHIEPLDR